MSIAQEPAERQERLREAVSIYCRADELLREAGSLSPEEVGVSFGGFGGVEKNQSKMAHNYHIMCLDLCIFVAEGDQYNASLASEKPQVTFFA